METPIADIKPHSVKFGEVDGEMRGNPDHQLMNPPISVNDNYFWLRDDLRKNEDVLQHLRKENAFAEHHMSDTKDLQSELYKEMLSRVKEDYDSLPSPHGEGGWNSPYLYFIRTVKDKSYTIHCRINRETNEEEVLLDENKLAEGKEHCDVSGFYITNNHKMISYGVDEEGNEKYKFFIKDLEKGEFVEHNIPDLMYCGYSWYDNKTVFYTMGNKENRMYQIWKYELDGMKNTLIFQCDNPLFSVGFGFSDDKRYLFIGSSSFDTSSYYYFDMKQLNNDKNRDNENNINQKLNLFTPDVKGRKYDIDCHEGTWFIHTNQWKGQRFSNFAIFTVKECEGEDIGNEDNWAMFDEYDESVYTKGISFTKNYVFIRRRQNGNDYVEMVKFDKNNENESGNGDGEKENRYLVDEKQMVPKPHDESIYQLSYIGLDIYDTDKIWYSFSSMTRPSGTYEYNLETGEITHLRTKEVPNYDADLYISERLYAKSEDGETSVPMSLIYNKNVWKKDSSHPLYLYGYGSYGITVHPTFSSLRVPLLDRGWAYVIAHVRGGSFNGYSWYEDGKMNKKMNTFVDFSSCAEHLIKEGYTHKDGITSEGRSAGGLLVGASMVLRPELFHCVVAGVPFVDVMNTMCDSTIPLTAPEWEQWGNPNVKEDFDYMLKYSPYDNIKEGVLYPHCLALGGLNDPRVQYWEPAKFIAKLRQYKKDNANEKDNSLMLCKIEMNEGHFSASDRYKYLRETAYHYAFVLKVNDIPLLR